MEKCPKCKVERDHWVIDAGSHAMGRLRCRLCGNEWDRVNTKMVDPEPSPLLSALAAAVRSQEPVAARLTHEEVERIVDFGEHPEAEFFTAPPNLLELNLDGILAYGRTARDLAIDAAVDAANERDAKEVEVALTRSLASP